ncbi:MAG: GIY-YIG nuclease family protein [Beijerinckiaceae bacterium]
MPRDPCVYIMANQRNGTLYTGVTANLSQRVWQHREGKLRGFTRRYGCKLLVFHEHFPTMPEAISREKQIKAGSRTAKLKLIEAMNPEWADLYETMLW